MDIARRFNENPLIIPSQAKTEISGSEIIGLLNPAVFKFQNKICLLLRVAERLTQHANHVSTIIQSPSGQPTVFSVSMSDPDYKADDSRAFFYKNERFLTSCSCLRIASSDDGRNFTLDDHACLRGAGELETFGIEDARVTQIDNEYLITYTMVSSHGFGVGLKSTCDWKTFKDFGMILPPMNKDAAIFDHKINGEYAMLHRPIGDYLGGPYIWYSTSPDLYHWGHHRCVAHPRPGKWDSKRIGVAASPIKTPMGYLMIYHGANEQNRYCTGAMLLDINDPAKVIARSAEPIMEPLEKYEKQGFFGNVIFCNGYIADADNLLMYYGAADECIAGAELSIKEIIATLQ